MICLFFVSTFRYSDQATAVRYLLDALDAHMTHLQEESPQTLGVEYYVEYHPDLIIDMSKLYFGLLSEGDTLETVLPVVLTILKRLTVLIPGYLEAWLLLGRCYLLDKQMEECQM
jgi:hypothetical protein